MHAKFDLDRPEIKFGMEQETNRDIGIELSLVQTVFGK